MNPKDLLIAHGEKAAVSLTLLLCAWEIWSVTTDESIRPANITPARIAEQNAGIDKIFIDGKAPVLKPVPDYLGEMKRRFTQPLTAPMVDAWLTAPPDRGPSARGLLAYVYEASAPTLTATDAVGKVALAIALPTATRPADRRLSDALEVSWKRPDENVTNRAQVIGVRVEFRIGDGDWKPLAGNGLVQGMIPLAQLPTTGPFMADGLEPWVRHTFRVSLVVKATGPEAGAPSPSQAVLVLPGRLAGDDVNWTELTERLRSGDAAFLARFAKPMTGPAPEWAALQGGERLYLGAPSEEVSVSVTSDVRFAFDKVATDLKDPTLKSAHVLVTKMNVGQDGQVQWLPEPKLLTAPINGHLKGEVDVVTARGRQKVNIDTGFKVAEIKPGQTRVLYYEIRERARVGTRAKDLEVVPKTVTTDVLVVENLRSRTRMELVRLGSIRRPAKADAIVYPAVSDAVVNEEEIFRRQPGDFHQAPLVPPAPKMHQPGTGPLVKIRAEHPGDESFYETDTPYVELADGRLVWYEPLNRRVRQWPEPVAPAVDPAAPAAPPTEPPPAGAPGATPPAPTPTTGGPRPQTPPGPPQPPSSAPRR